MNAAVLQDMLIGTAVIGAFLLIGAFLRARVPLFRRWLLPASVIGGIAGALARQFQGHSPTDPPAGPCHQCGFTLILFHLAPLHLLRTCHVPSPEPWRPTDLQ